MIGASVFVRATVYSISRGDTWDSQRHLFRRKPSEWCEHLVLATTNQRSCEDVVLIVRDLLATFPPGQQRKAVTSSGTTNLIIEI